MKFERVHIEGVGYELPPTVVKTVDLEARLSPVYRALKIPSGQVRAMTGIIERRYWEPGFPLSLGAARAAKKALATTNVPATDIEVLIYGGVCREHFEPATATHVAARLQEMGLAVSDQAAVFDVGNACLGVVSGMVEIANRIELGQIRAGMVVSCESAREIVDRSIGRMLAQPDMATFRLSVATLTGGSGAVAVVLTDGSYAGSAKPKLIGGVHRNAPQHHNLCRWGVSSDRGEWMETDSVAVLEHGVALGHETWLAMLDELGWNQADRTICHQIGNSHRMHILRRLGLQPEADFVTFDTLGNTGTVALPLALAIAQERGFIEPGQRVGLLGIGSGLNCTMLGAEF